jgi:hypothetical protein
LTIYAVLSGNPEEKSFGGYGYRSEDNIKIKRHEVVSFICGN